VEPLVNNLA